LIVDEVHDYAPYTNKLLERIITIRARLRLPTILLTATLSNRQFFSFVEAFEAGVESEMNKEAFKTEAFPRATRCSEEAFECTALSAGQDEKTVEVEFEHNKNQIFNFLKTCLNDGKCVAWIRNTVDDALATARRVDFMDPSQVTLFHSRFALGDRLQIEDRILSRYGHESGSSDREGSLVVGTQVLEQSLDVDFDVMVTDLAPMDRLLQRMGRLHRHDFEREYSPKMIVHSPRWDEDAGEDWYEEKFPGGACVYQKHGVLWKTMQVLRREDTWTIPRDNRDLIEDVFQREYEETLPSPLRKVDVEQESEELADSTMGDFNAIQFKQGYGNTRGYREDTPTRLGEERERARFVKVIDGRPQPWDFDSDGSDSHWTAGDFGLAARKIAAPDLQNNRGVIKEAVNRMQDVNSVEAEQDNRIIVPLEKSEEGWTGTAQNSEGNRVKISYDHETGIEVEFIT
jgi:CRISPR-associated endonuclease/helicase Cas3